MVDEAVEERGRELLVTTEDLGPLAEREVDRHDDRLPLVAVRDEVEEQLAPGAVEGYEAEAASLGHRDGESDRVREAVHGEAGSVVELSAEPDQAQELLR